jgi:hypothetical protein
MGTQLFFSWNTLAKELRPLFAPNMLGKHPAK